MAWRPIQYLIEGQLENKTPGKVSGWLRFEGMEERVTVELTGDFHRDIRGATIRLTGPAPGNEKDPEEREMVGFAMHQTGEAGDITAGLPPFDYGCDPYIEWYSEQNGLIVLEPSRERIRVEGQPVPFAEAKPVDRTKQDALMAGWLATLAEAHGLPALFTTKGAVTVTQAAYTHLIRIEGRVIGEAELLMPVNDDFFGVRLWSHVGDPTVAFGVVSKKHLHRKKTTPVS